MIMNQPKGSRIVRPRKKRVEEEAQTDREASDESEFTTSGLDSNGMDSAMGIDLTEETPTPEVLSAPPQPTFLSTLNTVVSFHPEAPPPKQSSWRHKIQISKPMPKLAPVPAPAPVVQATPPVPSRQTPKAATPPNAPGGFRAHINTLTAPPPRQTAGAEPPHQIENVRVVYPEPPPAATIERIDPDLAAPRGLELPSPVVPQYPSFPTF